MNFKKVVKETLNLLYWTMLAACTVGPGTVVTCARAGAEYELNLIWSLIFASIVAYTLQEGTARLTIVSGRSLGQCLQLKYRNGRKIWRVGVICWVVAMSVFFGNTLYECNNFAGGMSAIYSLPPASNTHALRISCCLGYAVIVLVLLFADKVDSLGVALGMVMLGMVVLFLVVVINLGLDLERFGKGLLPISMPSGSTNIVLSLIGTTSLGFNLFLGGEMAKGKTLPSAQRGIAFSTLMALVVSVLILIVGDGTHHDSKGVFTIASLAGIITRLTGEVGTWVFGIGFIAAALSSMLAVPLGAALTADSVFSILNSQPSEYCDQNESLPPEDTLIQSTFDARSENVKLAFTPSTADRPFPKRYYRSIMFVMVLISACTIAADAPTVKVILIAQVFNGCLLPFFSICLLLCLNDPVFMKASPQKGWTNCLLLIVVLITLFLTSNTVIQNLFGWIVTNQHTSEKKFNVIKFSIAAVISVTLMAILLAITDLGRSIKNSFKTSCCSSGDAYQT